MSESARDEALTDEQILQCFDGTHFQMTNAECVEAGRRIAKAILGHAPTDYTQPPDETRPDHLKFLLDAERAAVANYRVLIGELQDKVAEREQMWHDIGGICASGWTRDNEMRSPNEWAEALLYERDELRKKLQAAELALVENKMPDGWRRIGCDCPVIHKPTCCAVA